MGSSLACLIAAAALTLGDSYDPVVRGRVVDASGRPVAGAEVGSALFNAGSLPEEKADAAGPTSGPPAGALREPGRMRVESGATAVTDADGRFELPTYWSDRQIVALAPDHTASGLALVSADGGAIEIRLGPPARVRGRVGGSVAGKPRFGIVFACLPPTPEHPLKRSRVASCWMVDGEFAFGLPAGPYELELLTTVAPDARFESPVRLTAGPERPTVDLGTLPAVEEPDRAMELFRRRMANSWWTGDFARLHGHEPPRLRGVAGRGVAASAQPADFRGKWLLIYFWKLGCAPCITTTIPELIRLRERHADQLDRFEILAVCLDFEEELPTIADFDRRTRPAVDRVWRKPLPFPVLVDPSTETAREYGLEGPGRALLINPEGKVVPGGIEALRAVLDGKRSEPDQR